MRTSLASILMLLATVDISQAADSNATAPAPAQRDPTTTVTAPASQPSASPGVINNLADLTDEQVQAQLAALQAELARRKQAQNVKLTRSPINGKVGQSKGDAKPPQSGIGDTARFQQQYLRELGYPNEAIAAPPPKPAVADPCDPQRLFIRANSLDNYLYGITPASKAKGASVSYTDD